MLLGYSSYCQTILIKSVNEILLGWQLSLLKVCEKKITMTYKEGNVSSKHLISGLSYTPKVRDTSKSSRWPWKRPPNLYPSFLFCDTLCLLWYPLSFATDWGLSHTFFWHKKVMGPIGATTTVHLESCTNQFVVLIPRPKTTTTAWNKKNF